jgi:hypothetical protein
VASVFTLRNAIYGFGTWAIPFVLAFAFFDRTGQLTIDETFFKSIMIVVGGISGAWLLTRAFRRVEPVFVTGLVLGLFWLAINYAFDLAVLVAMMGQDPLSWFTDIGLRYLVLPAMAAGMGAVGAWAQIR